MMYPLFLIPMFILKVFHLSPSLILIMLIGILTSLVLICCLAVVFAPYLAELMSTDHRPPIVGPVTNQLIHFHKHYDYMTSISKKYPTFRFIAPARSEVYTVDPVNVQYILKTNFANYNKVLLFSFLRID